MSDVLTTDEVADLLECEPKTIEEKLRRGELPGVKFGRSWMLPRQALMETLNDLARKNLAEHLDKAPAIENFDKKYGRVNLRKALPHLPKFPE